MSDPEIPRVAYLSRNVHVYRLELTTKAAQQSAVDGQVYVKHSARAYGSVS